MGALQMPNGYYGNSNNYWNIARWYYLALLLIEISGIYNYYFDTHQAERERIYRVL